MVRQIRAKFCNGRFEPLEDVGLDEGAEVTITITIRKQRSEEDVKAFRRAAGSWKGLVDTDALLRDIAESRKRLSPPVDLGL